MAASLVSGPIGAEIELFPVCVRRTGIVWQAPGQVGFGRIARPRSMTPPNYKQSNPGPRRPCQIAFASCQLPGACTGPLAWPESPLAAQQAVGAWREPADEPVVTVPVRVALVSAPRLGGNSNVARWAIPVFNWPDYDRIGPC
jgi:hypothetical protein